MHVHRLLGLLALIVSVEVACGLHVQRSGTSPLSEAPAQAALRFNGLKTQQPVLRRSKGIDSQHEPLQALRGGSSGQELVGPVLNLIKNIVGSGVMSLAGGVAAYSDEPNAVYLSTILCAISASLAGYCFSLVGRVCLMTKATSYKDAWVKTLGSETAWIPTAFVSFKTFVACLCYSIIIGDLLRDLAKSRKAKGALANREVLLAGLTILVLLPLCLLRSFAALQYTSLLGIAGTLLTCFHMALRYTQGAYSPGGQYYDQLAVEERPFFSKKGTRLVKILILMSTFTSSFFAHYNAPKFLDQMRGGDVEKKFNILTAWGFFGSWAFNVTMLIFGFLTFGGASKSLILNNYAATDTLANLARFGVLSSVIFGFPLSYVGFRDGVMGAFPADMRTQSVKDIFAVVALTMITGLAMVVRDLGVPVALFGALLGSCIIFVFPALMYIQLLRKRAGTNLAALGFEYYANFGVAGTGIFLAIMGVTIVLLKNYTTFLK